METTEARELFERLFTGVDGHAAAAAYVRSLPKMDYGFTYGEIVADSFHELVAKAGPKPGEVFYDLGSGSGKAIIYASLAFEFSKVVGIELVPQLADLSRDVLKRCRAEAKKAKHAMPKVELITGSFVERDVTDAGFIFSHAHCVGEELDKMKPRLEATKPGTRMVLLGNRFSSPAFKLRERTMCQLTWGPSSAYIYDRV